MCLQLISGALWIQILDAHFPDAIPIQKVWQCLVLHVDVFRSRPLL